MPHVLGSGMESPHPSNTVMLERMKYFVQRNKHAGSTSVILTVEIKLGLSGVGVSLGYET